MNRLKVLWPQDKTEWLLCGAIAIIATVLVVSLGMIATDVAS